MGPPCLVTRSSVTNLSYRTPALVLLHDGFASAPIAVQEAQMVFIASLFKPTAPPTSSSPSTAPPRLSLQAYATSLLQVVRAALISTRPPLRILACGVLASPILAELKVDLLPLDPFAEALRLADDDNASVKASAVRAMGLLVKSPLFESVSCSSLAVLLPIADLPYCHRGRSCSTPSSRRLVRRAWKRNPSSRQQAGQSPTAAMCLRRGESFHSL